MLKNKIIFIFGCSVLNAAVLLSGILGLQTQFLIVGLIIYFTGSLLLKYSPFKKIVSYTLIFGLFSLLLLANFIGSFFIDGFLGYPLVFISFCSIVSVIYIYDRLKKKYIVFTLIFILFLVSLTILLPNYYNYRSYTKQNNSIEHQSIGSLEIFDSHERKVNLVEKKGKILVFDIWDSSCGVCIREFPKFEQLQAEFKNDPYLEFYTLNLPLKRDKRPQVEKYTNQYSFKKLYAGENVRKDLKINLIPKYLVIDTDGNIKYIGSLNTGEMDFYKNFYSIISEIKNEKNN